MIVNLVATYSRNDVYAAFVVGCSYIGFAARRWLLLAASVAAIGAAHICARGCRSFLRLGDPATVRGTPETPLPGASIIGTTFSAAGEGGGVTGLGLGLVAM